MRSTTRTIDTNEEGLPMHTTEADSTLIEQKEYEGYCALLGIEPSKAARPSGDGLRTVRLDAAEVARMREMAKFAHADPHDGDDDVYYRRHRSAILGVTS